MKEEDVWCVWGRQIEKCFLNEDYIKLRDPRLRTGVFLLTRRKEPVLSRRQQGLSPPGEEEEPVNRFSPARRRRSICSSTAAWFFPVRDWEKGGRQEGRSTPSFKGQSVHLSDGRDSSTSLSPRLWTSHRLLNVQNCPSSSTRSSSSDKLKALVSQYLSDLLHLFTILFPMVHILNLVQRHSQFQAEDALPPSEEVDKNLLSVSRLFQKNKEIHPHCRMSTSHQRTNKSMPV
ncbi:unnamed protein product [Pleuronectes platessa]|uniref:Uncharacterized protein n=1 Tax=Pleuronectes platessa TaxID=8262 RepID=A0A9N7U0C7_PLEPL|nr:unnamed protein product [Pleuronectes platessa]